VLTYTGWRPVESIEICALHSIYAGWVTATLFRACNKFVSSAMNLSPRSSAPASSCRYFVLCPYIFLPKSQPAHRVFPHRLRPIGFSCSICTLFPLPPNLRSAFIYTGQSLSGSLLYLCTFPSDSNRHVHYGPQGQDQAYRPFNQPGCALLYLPEGTSE
jgi:hypothetical protein